MYIRRVAILRQLLFKDGLQRGFIVVEIIENFEIDV
jgi:hypothetical protein